MIPTLQVQACMPAGRWALGAAVVQSLGFKAFGPDPSSVVHQAVSQSVSSRRTRQYSAVLARPSHHQSRPARCSSVFKASGRPALIPAPPRSYVAFSTFAAEFPGRRFHTGRPGAVRRSSGAVRARLLPSRAVHAG